jgi:predicted ATPase
LASAALRLHLRERSLLLVLDSFEHVMLAAPELTDLLASAPEIKLLVTSTAVLHVYSERELVVPPMELPDRSADHDPNALLDVPSVALFVHRAEAVNAEFAFDASSAPAVAEICRRLDGLPLAIELAAARTKLLPPQAMLERLGRRLDLLGGGTRDAPARHQALRTTIDWSYGLLDDDEQRLFARLGVFAGGCTLEAADAVCGKRTTLLDEIASLLDKSLLRSSGEEPRLSMLETLREYALERLEASGAADELRRRHAAYYVALAERAEPELTGAQQARWYERLEVEHDNLRAALTYALSTRRTSLALRLSAALARFWQVRGYAGEGRRWLLESLTQDNDDTPSWLRAKALVRAGVLSLRNGHYREARPLLEESAELYGGIGDPEGRALATLMLGQVTMVEGHGERALALLQHAADAYRELGDRRGFAVALNDVGCARLFLGDPAGAARDCSEAALLSADHGDRQAAATHMQNASYALLELGREDEAVAKITQSVELSRELGYKEGLAVALLAFAAVAQHRGESDVAARLLAASDAHTEAIGAVLDPLDRGIHDRIASSVSSALGERPFADAWADGRSLEPEKALAYALAATSSTG